MKKMTGKEIKEFVDKHIEPFAGHRAAIYLEDGDIAGSCCGMLSSCWEGRIPVTTVRMKDDNNGVLGISIEDIHHIWVYAARDKGIAPRHIKGKFSKFYVSLNTGKATLYIDKDNQYASVDNIIKKVMGIKKSFKMVNCHDGNEEYLLESSNEHGAVYEALKQAGWRLIEDSEEEI